MAYYKTPKKYWSIYNKPHGPLKPVEPVKMYYQDFVEFYSADNDTTFALKDVELPDGVKLEDVFVSSEAHYDYDSTAYSTVKLGTKIFSKRSQKSYDDAVKRYKKQLKEYEANMIEYKAELKEWKAWKKEEEKVSVERSINQAKAVLKKHGIEVK